MSLYNELKRRNVIRVAMAYVVAAWLIIQVVETILPAFGYGDAAIRYIVIVLAIAFIPTLVFSWAFEITPEGVKREVDVVREHSITRFTGKKLDRVIMVLLALGMGYFAFDKFVLDPARDQSNIEIARQEGLTAALSKSYGDRSIAVLPFENRSNREEDQFFTDGIHDDLLTTIAKIGSMKVISRTSVMEYRDTIKKIPQIAQELGVANILEGGIQRSGNQVRINVQLIDAATDEHLWAEIYDRELTAENLFAVQSEITRIIADALQAELSTDEQRRIDARPTDNLQAYEAYMRGRQLMATRDSANLKLATEEFARAVEIDRLFALAWEGEHLFSPAYDIFETFGIDIFFTCPPLLLIKDQQAVIIRANRPVAVKYRRLKQFLIDKTLFEFFIRRPDNAVELLLILFFAHSFGAVSPTRFKENTMVDPFKGHLNHCRRKFDLSASPKRRCRNTNIA